MNLLVIFFHFAGIIIGLGAVTIIDTFGLFYKDSKKKIQLIKNANQITTPLVLVGFALMILTWIFLYSGSLVSIYKSALMLILLANGTFLYFYLNPRINKLPKGRTQIPKKLVNKMRLNRAISFIAWWTLVAITIIQFY